MMNKFIILILYIFIIYSNINGNIAELKLINFVTTYITHNLKTIHMAVTAVNRPNKLSSTFRFSTQQIMQRFPSIVVDLTVFSNFRETKNTKALEGQRESIHGKIYCCSYFWTNTPIAMLR